MATEIYVRRMFSTLVPATPEAEDRIRELPSGVELRVTVSRPLNARQMALFRAVCDHVAKILQAMGDDGTDHENVAMRFKVALGYSDLLPLTPALQRATGCKYAVHERSLAKMDEAAFGRFIDRFVAFCLTELVPSLPTKEFRDEIAEILLNPKPRREKS